MTMYDPLNRAIVVVCPKEDAPGPNDTVALRDRPARAGPRAYPGAT